MGAIARAADYLGRRLFQGVIDREVRKALADAGENDYGTTVSDSSTPIQNILSNAYRSCVWVWACMSVIAWDCAQVPAVVKKLGKRKQGKREAEVVDDHPAYAVIDKPNAYQGWGGVMEEAAWNLLQWGRVCLEKGKAQEDGKGLTTGFLVLPSAKIDVKPSSDLGQLFQEIVYRATSGRPETYRPEECVFVRRFDVGGAKVKGISPLEPAKHPYYVEDGVDKLTLSVVENSPWASFILRLEGAGARLNAAQVQELYNQIDRRLRGPEKAGRPIFVDNLKTEPVRNALADIPFQELGTENRDKILAAFGVPPAKLGIMEYSSFANAEEMDRRYWTQTIPPWLDLIYDALNRQWMDLEHPGYWLAPDYAAMGTQTQAQREAEKSAETGFVQGVFRLDEARAKCGLPPDPENGQKYAWELRISSAAGLNGGGQPFGQKPEGEGTPDPAADAKADEQITEDGEGRFVVRSRQTKRTIGTYATRAEARAAVRDLEGKAATEKGLKPMRKGRWDDDDIFAMRKGLDDVIDAQAPRFTQWALRLFKSQQKEILRATRQHFGREVRKDAGDAEALMRRYQQILKEIAAQRAADLYDAYVKTIQGAAGSTIEATGFDLSFDVRNPEITKWVEVKVPRLCVQVNDTTSKRLVEAVKSGLDAGENYDQIEDRIVKAFEDFLDPRHRPATIARTEGIDAANFGAVETFRQSGVVEKQEWISTLDNRCRDTHLAANGQTRPLGSPFDVGGAQLRWPGDGELDAPPEELCNCRCTIVPVMSPKA